MKRIATIGAVITVFAIAPASAMAGAGKFAPQVKPQFRAQVVSAQVTSVQRARAAFTLQTYRAQLVQTQKWTKLPAPIFR